MSDVPHDLQKIAEVRITPQSSLDEIERVASIAKTSSESLKAKREAENARHAPLWELLKTLVAIVVPIVSLVTLYLTIGIQSMQLNESQRQNEETQWREFIKAIRDSRDDVISDPTLVPELKSFLGSKTIGPHVRNLAKYLAVRIADTTAFGELLSISFSPSLDNIPPEEIVDLNRGLNQLVQKVIEACDSANFGESPSFNGSARISIICNPNASFSVLNGAFDKFSKELRKEAFKARRDYLAVMLEVQETSRRLADSMRKVHESYQGKGVTLKGTYLYYADFSNIDFSGVDVTNATFDSVGLSGASFVKSLGRPFIRGCNWWQAKDIPLDWLIYLKGEAFPGGPLGTPFVSDQKPQRKQYEDDVAALYRRSGASAEKIPTTFDFNTENLTPFPLPR